MKVYVFQIQTASQLISPNNWKRGGDGLPSHGVVLKATNTVVKEVRAQLHPSSARIRRKSQPHGNVFQTGFPLKNSNAYKRHIEALCRPMIPLFAQMHFTSWNRKTEVLFPGHAFAKQCNRQYNKKDKSLAFPFFKKLCRTDEKWIKRSNSCIMKCPTWSDT